VDAHLTLQQRAAIHFALGEPVRLAIVDELRTSDRSPVELRRSFDLASNLLAHHLDVLEGADLIERSRSTGDGRRRYVRLRPHAFDGLDGFATDRWDPIGDALFVCTANSARSPLAAAMWHTTTGRPATSAGTRPAASVHPMTVDAARRAGLELIDATPRALADVDTVPDLVVTVCDRAHEELDPDENWLHWSIPDPAAAGTAAAFDATVDELGQRIASLMTSTHPPPHTRSVRP